MLKRIFKWLLGLVAVLVAIVAVFAINAVYFRPWSLRVFYEKIFLEFALENPEILSSLGLLEQFGITGHNARLSDVSVAKQKEQLERTKRNLAELRAYPLAKQNESEKLSTHLLDWFLQMAVEGEKFQFHNYPVNQLFGVQNGFPTFMANTHRMQRERDARYYIQRLEALPTKFDQVIEGLRLRESMGILPPRFVVERVLKEMNEFVAQPVAENILAKSFQTRLVKVPDLSDAQRAELNATVQRTVTERVYPAYRKLIDYFTALLPKTTTDDGVWKLPNGEEFYAYMLRQNTTTKLKPAEIHELGLLEVARIEGEMRAILDAQGHTGRTVGEWMTELAKDGKFQFPDNDEGRTAAIAEYNRLITQALERSKESFRVLPKAKVEVRRIPEFKEKTAPGAYYEPGAFDGSRPGVFYCNLRDMKEVSKFGMPTLAYHEAVPGHHFQITIAQELQGVPTFRKILPFTAYAEGWALYTEWLAKQAGWYKDDPYGDLGRLQAELFRAVRLVVDTGIHHKRWTREQAIAYMLGKTGMGEKDVTSEIERYIVMPGQACAYKVGMLKIVELRRRAETALGPKFDQKDFHDVVLKTGSLPLEILEEQVDAWIARAKGA
ncbi:hypothetical protein AYO41_03025 [Verrucomicrobia bacterium SCGC AG-212-E04]|nr:hypothetical protein AYO41_03025 [Verrucomicrobia bacterium SCGC AG-212-E04]